MASSAFDIWAEALREARLHTASTSLKKNSPLYKATYKIYCRMMRDKGLPISKPCAARRYKIPEENFHPLALEDVNPALYSYYAHHNDFPKNKKGIVWVPHINTPYRPNIKRTSK